jgi:hypothetical protein
MLTCHARSAEPMTQGSDNTVKSVNGIHMVAAKLNECLQRAAVRASCQQGCNEGERQTTCGPWRHPLAQPERGIMRTTGTGGCCFCGAGVAICWSTCE